MTEQQRDNVTHLHCIKIRISIIIINITTLPKLMLLGDFSLITCHRSYPFAIESDYFCYEMLWHLKEKIEPKNRFCLWPFCLKPHFPLWGSKLWIGWNRISFVYFTTCESSNTDLLESSWIWSAENRAKSPSWYNDLINQDTKTKMTFHCSGRL